MPFTMEQVEMVAHSTYDFVLSKKPRNQHIQEKPLLSRMRKKERTIPGGKGRVDLPVILETASRLQGFAYDDTVGYGNPAKLRRVSAPWRLFHIGIQWTMHELLHEGISMTDTADGKGRAEHTDRELIALTNIFEHKIADMEEGFDKDLNELFWRDGTQSALAFPGVLGWVVDTPSSATVVGGLDQSANAKWRNRANLNITLGVSADTQAVLRTLDLELPQLRRFGGRPNLGMAGSDMIDRLKAERRAKGVFTQTGFSKNQDLAVGDIEFDGITFYYDPTLDDLGYSKRLYLLDDRRITPFVVDGEAEKKHNPTRPEDKYVGYMAKTHVTGMIADQRNCHGVYAFA